MDANQQITTVSMIKMRRDETLVRNWSIKTASRETKKKPFRKGWKK